MVVLKIVRYTTCYEQSFSKTWHQHYFFWHKVHRGCKSHRELQKPSAARSCSSHPLNTNIHTDRLSTKTNSPYVPKGWLVPAQGRWQPAQHRPQAAQSRSTSSSASHNSSTHFTISWELLLGNSGIGFQEPSFTQTYIEKYFHA